MAVSRNTAGQIIGRWIGIMAGLGFLIVSAYGAWEFIEQEGSGANPFDMAMAALQIGVIGGIAGGVIGAVWGCIVALISR